MHLHCNINNLEYERYSMVVRDESCLHIPHLTLMERHCKLMVKVRGTVQAYIVTIIEYSDGIEPNQFQVAFYRLARYQKDLHDKLQRFDVRDNWQLSTKTVTTRFSTFFYIAWDGRFITMVDSNHFLLVILYILLYSKSNRARHVLLDVVAIFLSCAVAVVS